MRCLTFLLLVICLPILSFRYGQKQDAIIGKWKMEMVKPARGTIQDDGTEQRKMDGDEVTFYQDNSVKYYKNAQGKTYNGSWKVTKGERGQIKASTSANTQENDPGLERFMVLEIDLSFGKKAIKIIGEDFTVTGQKLLYTEAKNGTKYWYYWARANSDESGNN